MELTEKKLRKFFLEAFEQVAMPQFERIHAKLDEHDARFDGIEREIFDLKKRLLDLEEKIIPKFAEIQEQFEIVVRELDEIQRGGGNKQAARNIKNLEGLIGRLKGELNKVVARVVKFEGELKKLKQTQKRKIAK